MQDSDEYSSWICAIEAKVSWIMALDVPARTRSGLTTTCRFLTSDGITICN